MGKSGKRKRYLSAPHIGNNKKKIGDGRELSCSLATDTLNDAQQLKKKLLKKEEVVLVEDFLLKKQKKSKSCQETGLDNLKNSNLTETLRGSSDCCSSSDLKSTLDDGDEMESLRYFTGNLNKSPGVLFLSQKQKIALEGFVQLSVLCGEVEINGYKISGNMVSPVHEYDVFSAPTYSLQYIKDASMCKITVEQKRDLENCLRMLSVEEEELEMLISYLKDVTDIYSCVVIKSMNTLLPTVLKKLNNFHVSPTPKLYPAPFVKPVLDTDIWHDILSDFEEKEKIHSEDCSCSVMMCGGKDVGKSTLSRYVINGLLNNHKSVFYLECDCGQTEFTPPAVLSLVKVTKPLFGPPFSHLMKPVRSFFYGHISPGNTPKEYISIIEQLFQTYHYEHVHEGPLVINQQGWVRGLGLSLLVDVINLTSPCYIVQINSSMESRNLVSDLNDKFLSGEIGWSIGSQQPRLKQLSHPCTYVKIECPALSKEFDLGKNKSLTSRNLAISSYFSKLYQTDFDVFCASTKESLNNWIPPSLSALYPWCVAWRDIAVHVIHEKISDDVVHYALNMSVVCLACVEHEWIVCEETEPLKLRNEPRGEFLGLGIIRNIDPINKLFYILTPESTDILDQVNALLKGNIQLPTQFLQEDGYSSQPYFCHDYISLSTKTASGMKPRFNLKRKPSKLKNTFSEKS